MWFHRTWAAWLIVLAVLCGLPAASPVALAQGLMPGGAGPYTALGAGGATEGNYALPQFSTRAGPGELSADYTYRSYNYQGGVRFSELSLSYYLPYHFGQTTSGTVFAEGAVNSLPQTDATSDRLKSALRFGGSGMLQVASGASVGIRGEYDAILQGAAWRSGGQVGVQMFCAVPGGGYTGLRVNRYFNSARDSLELAPTSGGYDVSVAYRHAIGTNTRAIFSLSGYDMGSGAETKQRGLCVGAGLLSGFVELKCFAGRDNVNLDYFSLTCGVNIGF
jgi:hypothetical protein